MTTKNLKISHSLPVFMSFIVMGFIDVVGVATGYIKKDYGLTDNIAQFIPSMAFLWFFLLSVPTGILQDKYGKRKVLNIGMAVTGLGMIVPFIHYSFPVMMVAIILLGIGNTIVQVSANPLLQDVVPSSKLASYMSLSQFIKAICSLLGPVITTFMATRTGNWKLVFLVYAVTSFLAVIWLYFTRIEESKPDRKPATFKTCLSLLANPFILLMVIAIFLIVGADVGMNSNIANYLQKTFNLTLEDASLGISIYFTALMIGRFLGAVILNWIPARRFLVITVLLALAAFIGMIVAPDVWMARVCIFLAGLGAANTFPLIFSITLEKMPGRSNEISGLMIMAVAGGAVIPPVMGIISASVRAIVSLFVLVACMGYVLMAAFYSLKR
jgi:FHS family L-fucose permease-like MFS transporter